MTTKKNSLLFKIKVLDDNDDFNINNVIDLFLDDGIFQPYLDKIFGITTHNYQLKIYKVNFKDTTPKKILEDLYNTFCEPEIISTKNNIEFSIQVIRPQGFRQLFTLYPMPFDVSNENIQEIANNWGSVKHYEFGKHKKCPIILNHYLHLFIENFNRKNVPDALIFRNRFISVSVDGKPQKEKWNYCKATSHEIENCPKKLENNQNQSSQTSTEFSTNKTPYAKTISSSPKTNQPTFIHSLTKLKISKKANEKNNKNFPPLDPNEPNQNNIKHSPDKPSAASINISEEEVIKSFDNFQFKKTPTQKAKCVNIQNETSNSPKKNKMLKEKTFFLPSIIHHNNHHQIQKKKLPQRKEKTV